MGLINKINDFIAPVDEEEELELNEEEAAALSAYEKPKDATVEKIGSNVSIVIFQPRNFDEAEEIGRHIKSKRACLINLEKMPLDFRQRTIDFLSGVVYGVNGSIKKTGVDVILCSPSNLQVAGDINANNTAE